MLDSLFFIGCAVLLTWGCCLVYFRRKFSRSKAVHRLRVSELEDSAWRAQMNPHFLNNCLSNLNSLIQLEDIPTASRYLTSLSRLTRKVLENSLGSTITLAEELDMVRHYVILEQLRFGNAIIFEIELDEKLDPETILVPPFFIQPFLENSIIHGLLPKGAKGTVAVSLRKSSQEILYCSVLDDGAGRTNNSTPIFSDCERGKRSLGMSITRSRIMAFNQASGKTLPLMIRDLTDESGNPTGTLIQLELAFREV
ncbi:sensor histidine kinase YesM [Algoriphagus sp. 4150]|uniref:sensor histidine kinase n=1 Tax=Algoriphagus sp. 4150 TaxID=2817756 RepID=UPI00285601A6|nr:histidine kinase [Algoriphagus sp. 4150]MDR7132740.1 sensor histidine kinase YesM [Algoriphagus sp. 4150]